MVRDWLLRRLCHHRLRLAWFVGYREGLAVQAVRREADPALAEFREWLEHRLDHHDKKFERSEWATNTRDLIKTERAEARMIYYHLIDVIRRHHGKATIYNRADCRWTPQSSRHLRTRGPYP